MCPQNCQTSDLRAAQGHSIAVSVRTIDDLGHERDYWRDLFHRLCDSVGKDPNDTILSLSV